MRDTFVLFQFRTESRNGSIVKKPCKRVSNVTNKDLQVTDYEPPNKFADLLDKQLETLAGINDRVSNPRKDAVVEEWKTLARIVDRMCLILFSLFQFCGILILLCGTAFKGT